MSFRAVVFGPTGAVGAEVVRQCLAHPDITEVTAVTRRGLPVRNPQLREVRCADFLNLDSIADQLADQDVCFYCLGVSQLQVKDPEQYREITLDYTMEAARTLLDRSPGHLFHFLSGGGADPSGQSKVLFARVKGETERQLAELPVPKLVIWRPGYINPMVPRSEAPPFYERMARPMYPILRRVMPRMVTDTVEVARAMIQATMEGRTEGVIGNRELQKIAGRFPESVF